VPIYWGTPRVKELFNEAAFVYAGDYATLEDLADAVVAIDNARRTQVIYLPYCY
jgi:hypothetical protein